MCTLPVRCQPLGLYHGEVGRGSQGPELCSRNLDPSTFDLLIGPYKGFVLAGEYPRLGWCHQLSRDALQLCKLNVRLWVC